MAVKTSGEISFRSSAGVDISEEFGESSSEYKILSTNANSDDARYFGQTYLSGYYRGLIRNVTAPYPKYDDSGSAGPYAGSVLGGTNGAFLQVSFNPNASDNFTYATNNTGRSSKFTTKIESTSGKFSSEHIQTGASQITYPGNLKNMFVRENDDADESPFFISGSLVDVSEDSAGVVHLVYYLNITNKGDNDGVYNLPSLQFYGDITGHENAYAEYIWHSDKILPLSDVPRCDGQIHSTAKTAKFQYDAGNSSSGDTLTAQAIKRAASIPTPGRWGTRLIPQRDTSSVFNSVSGNLLKFSDFYAAQKKPELWEARAHHHIFRASTQITETNVPANDLEYQTLNTTNKKDRATLFYSWKVDTPNMRTAASINTGVFTTLTPSDSTAAVTEDTYDFGKYWGDEAAPESPRSDYRDYEWTTVVINHAQLGARVMDGTDTNGWFGYSGGNGGGVSDGYSLSTTKRAPTHLNSTEGVNTAGQSADLSLVDIYPMRGAYSWGGETTGNSIAGPYDRNSSSGLNNGISSSVHHPRSHWYVYQINLPPSEIAEFKVRFVGSTASKRFAKQELYVLPGKWECVNNTFKSPIVLGDPPTFTTSQRVANGLNTRQYANYGDVMFHTAFDEYKYGADSRLDTSNTSNNLRGHIHSTNYSIYQAYAGGAVTRVVSVLDPDDPTKDTAGGWLAYEEVQRAGTRSATGYLGELVDMTMRSTASQSFLMRCTDT